MAGIEASRAGRIILRAQRVGQWPDRGSSRTAFSLNGDGRARVDNRSLMDLEARCLVRAEAPKAG